MRFVVDASLLIDAFSKFKEERRRLALKVFEAIEGHEIYVPRICMIEFVNVLSRFIVGGILLTNDKRMAENAHDSGIGVYCILEEFNEFFKLLGVGE